jgi:hypothetical protein
MGVESEGAALRCGSECWFARKDCVVWLWSESRRESEGSQCKGMITVLLGVQRQRAQLQKQDNSKMRVGGDEGRQDSTRGVLTPLGT